MVGEIIILTDERESGSDVIAGQCLVCKTIKISVVHFHVKRRKVNINLTRQSECGYLYIGVPGQGLHLLYSFVSKQ